MHAYNNSLDKLSRAAQTRKKLKESFFQLYCENEIERIKVKDITDLAGYNRGTFYVYYKDIYALLKEIQDDMLNIFEKHVSFQMKYFLKEKDNVLHINDDDINVEHFHYFQVLNNDPRIKLKIKNILKDAIRSHFNVEKANKNSVFEYLLEYYLSANMGIIEYWITNSSSTPQVGFNSLLKMIDFVENKGFHAALKEYYHKS